MSALLAAIALGFLGSFHCLGMCGPIALALPVHRFGPLKKQLAVLVYQLGRLITYATLGALFGGLGQVFFPAAFQQGLSIVLGAMLLLALLLSRASWRIPAFPGYYKFIAAVKSQLSGLFHRDRFRFLFLTGLLNGLLPCGLVYMAMAGAVASGSVVRGAFFMLAFGLGTVPAMQAVAMLGQFLGQRQRTQLRRAVPVMVAVMGLLLILRGLNLGIPYLSPQLSSDGTHQCCNTMVAGPEVKSSMHCGPKHH